MANVYDLLKQGSGNNPDLDPTKTIDAEENSDVSTIGSIFAGS